MAKNTKENAVLDFGPDLEAATITRILTLYRGKVHKI